MKLPEDRGRQVVLMGGGLLVLAAGLGWWGLGRLAEQQAEAQVLADRMGNPSLAGLLAEPDGVARARRDTQAMQDLEAELQKKSASWTEIWAQETRKIAGEGEVWSSDPGKWKDRLIAVQSQLQKDAAASRIRLAPGFYLGLEAYREKSPTAEQVPALALHLGVAQRLVELFFQARKVQEQYPTVCEFLSLNGPGTLQADSVESPVKPPPAKAKPATSPLPREAFRLEMRCSPEVLYEYVRLISRDPGLFLITGLAVTNEKQSFPLRSEIAGKFSEEAKAGEESSGGPRREKKLLEILAGEESVSATMDVDFVVWSSEPGRASGAVPAPPPE